MNILNFNCVICHVHNSIQFKNNVEPMTNVFKHDRRLKKCHSQIWEKNNSLISESNINHAYNNFETAFMNTIDTHSPKKRKRSIQQPSSFINNEHRKALYKKGCCTKKISSSKLNLIQTGENTENREIL